MAADTTPYDYPSATDASQERFVLQQAATAAMAKVIRSQDRSVERQPIGDLLRLHKFMREERQRSCRMFHVQVEH
jgi:hypothetical protein